MPSSTVSAKSRSRSGTVAGNSTSIAKISSQGARAHAKLYRAHQVAVEVRHRRRQLDEHRQDLITQRARTHAKLHRLLRQVAVEVRHRRRQLDEHRQDLVTQGAFSLSLLTPLNLLLSFHLAVKGGTREGQRARAATVTTCPPPPPRCSSSLTLRASPLCPPSSTPPRETARHGYIESLSGA